MIATILCCIGWHKWSEWVLWSRPAEGSRWPDDEMYHKRHCRRDGCLRFQETYSGTQPFVLFDHSFGFHEANGAVFTFTAEEQMP